MPQTASGVEVAGSASFLTSTPPTRTTTARRSLPRPARVVLAIAAMIAAFAIDQTTKAVAQSGLGDGRVVELLPGFRFDLVYNPGVAFGLGGALGAPLVIGLMIVSAALVAWAVFRAVRGAATVGTMLLSAAAGGGVGNIWDRISRATEAPLTGEVVDFIAVDGFAVFNVADIFTTCGIAGWALATLLGSRRD